MHRILSGCLLSLALSAPGANAAEGDIKVESPYVKVAPVTVNLHGMTNFLQVTMTLKVANPLQVRKVKANMPVIQNELTYLLSDREADQFKSAVGKQMLIQQVRNAVNKALSLTVKEGVAEVFLESLIVD